MSVGPDMGAKECKSHFSCAWLPICHFQYFQPFPCKWVKCLEPEEPEAFLGLKRNWNGMPVPFWENITYTCQPGHYFIEDRDKIGFTVMCQESGEFDYPQSWPMCVRGTNFFLDIVTNLNVKESLPCSDSYCVTPPPKPLGGQRIWNLQNNYGTEVRYWIDVARWKDLTTNPITDINVDNQPCSWTEKQERK